MNSSVTQRIQRLAPAQREFFEDRLRRRLEPSNDKRLVTFLELRRGAKVGAAELLAYLRERLPEAAIPAQLRVVDALPYLPNGKLDRGALRQRSRDVEARVVSEREGPRGPVEELVAEVFSSVLGLDEVPRRADFLELGGHSLLAMRATSRLRNVYGVDLDVRAIFEHSSVARLAAHLAAKRADSSFTLPAALPRADRERPLPLSPAELRLWMLDRLRPGNPAYNIPGALRLEGELDVAALERAVQRLVERHEALRTNFVQVGEQPQQVIATARALELKRFDLSQLGLPQREAELARLARSHALHSFTLDDGPLLSLALVRLGAAEHALLWCIHHIVADGWSVGVFLRDLSELYAAERAGSTAALPPLVAQPADIAAWQRTQLESGLLAEQLSYWKARLDAAPLALELPTDRPHPPEPSGAGGVVSFVLPPTVAERLRAFARAHGSTTFMVLLAAYVATLARYTQQRDFVIGTPVANRRHAAADDMIGFFVNTLPLRLEVSDDPTFAELVVRAREVTLDAHAHQDVPFDRIVEALALPRDPSRTPLLQTLFLVQNTPEHGAALADLRTSSIAVPHSTAKFDWSIAMAEVGGVLAGELEYNADVFDESTARRFVAHFGELLEGALRTPALRVSSLPLLTAAERSRFVEEVNATELAFPQLAALPAEERTVVSLLDAAIERYGELPALIDKYRDPLSYRELSRRADLLAAEILSRGLRQEALVALLVERSIDYAICLVACLRAGVAFVPLDPEQPYARLERMLESAPCELCVCREAQRELGQALLGDARCLSIEALPDAGDRPTRRAPRPEQLAYVICTSGSTGVPKGAMVEHRGLVNHLLSKIHDLGMRGQDVVAVIAATTFDVSIWQFLAALLVGGTSSVFEGLDAWEPRALLAQMAAHRVSIVETVPSHLTVILGELEGGTNADLSSLRWMISNGEGLLPAVCERWFALRPNVPLVNMYGATECSDDTAHFKILGAPARRDRYMPIHGTLPNIKSYVLNEAMQPVPVGVVGEMYLGGVGVGRGYMGDPQKTARSFVPDPFSQTPGARLYRTFDLVRYLADESIDFVGRADHQVKIRGHRVELGEVETALARVGGVRESVVVVRGKTPDTARLVAYVVSSEASPDKARIEDELRAHLDAAMLPSTFVFMPQLPLLSNGKVDRNALPEPSENDRQGAVAYRAPRTETERQLAGIWSEILGREVGLDDNFFEIGGHSLVAIQTVTRVRAVFGVELLVREIFEAQSVLALADRIDARRSRADLHLDRVAGFDDGSLLASSPHAGKLRRLPPRDYHELSPYQLPEWFMHELSPDSPFYNVCLCNLILEGELDLDVFVRAWQTLIERHAVLRTYFGYVDARPVQRVRSKLELAKRDIYVDRTFVSEENFLAEVQRLASEYSAQPFDFLQGPLFTIKLAEFPGKRFLFLFMVHHIIWDETSTMNFALELSELYSAYLVGRAPRLPQLELSYTDFCGWIERALSNGELARERDFWRETLRDAPPPLTLPADRRRPARQSFEGDEVVAVFPHHLTLRLNRELQARRVTLYQYLLSVLTVQFHRLTGENDFVIGTPIANRNDERLAPLLGLFATAIPLRCRVQPTLSFAQLLQNTRELALQAYDHRVYPSVLALQETGGPLDASRGRAFSIMYGVQNNKTRLASEVHFEGLRPYFLAGVAVAEGKTAKFDLTIVVDYLENDDVLVRFNYASDLFDRETAERMTSTFLRLVEQSLDTPELEVARFHLLSDAERALLLRPAPVSVNSSANPEPIARFEALALARPDAMAIVEGERRVSYGELLGRVRALDAELRARRLGAEDTVCLLLGSSLSAVVALLALQRAGIAFMALEPGAPPQRIERAMSRAGARFVLGAGAPLPGLEDGWLDIDAERDELAASTLRPRAAEPENLAYVLFTSGTTGEPKGIMVTRGGLANVIDSADQDFPLAAEDRLCGTSPISFDPWAFDVLWALSRGASFVVVDPATSRSARQLGAWLAQAQVTVLDSVPLILNELEIAGRGGAFAPLPHLRHVVSGGAALSRELATRLASTFECSVANHYGPTEVTVEATRHLHRDADEGELVPIGRPIAHSRVLVLDETLNLVPIGVIGEIFVESPGVARGYLQNSGETAARFVPAPFGPPGARMYRTGDRGRWTRNGTLHFEGRADRQLKVGGSRVELEEVEAVLERQPGVWSGHVATNGETLRAFVRLEPSLVDVEHGGARYRIFTLEQRPDLRYAFDALHSSAWPAWFEGDQVVGEYWSRIYATFPQLQVALCDEEGAVLAVCNAVPSVWDGSIAALPEGWSQALGRAFSAMDERASTLFLLTAVVDEAGRGRNLSTLLLRHVKRLASGLGYERVLVAVRPTAKARHPELSFHEFCALRRDDGLLVDPWLRAHAEVGGRVLGVAERSQSICASLSAWARWLNLEPSAVGETPVPELFGTLLVDRGAGTAEYVEPAVWVEHAHSAQGSHPPLPPWRHVHPRGLLERLRQELPEYMVPKTLTIVDAWPTTENGKVDTGRLLSRLPGSERKMAPHTATERAVAKLWRELLGGPEPSVNDSFFELGGHSMRAVEMLERLREQLDASLTLKQLFSNPTISGLAALVDSVRRRAPAPGSSSSKPTSRLTTATATATGHHGELFQGVLQRNGNLHRCLVTLACDAYSSQATFVPDRSGIVTVEPPWRVKALRAAELVLQSSGDGLGGRLEIRSRTPVGWGLGSSTSDVVASLRAAAGAIGVRLDARRLGELAVRAECGTDPVMFEGRDVLFAHREGFVLEEFASGRLQFEVLGFNTDPAGVDTLAMPPAAYDEDEQAELSVVLALLRHGMRCRDLRTMGAAATASARINQRFLPKPHFEALTLIAEDTRALGLQVAHSGTVVGLLFDPASSELERQLDRGRRALAELGFDECWRFRSAP